MVLAVFTSTYITYQVHYLDRVYYQDDFLQQENDYFCNYYLDLNRSTNEVFSFDNKGVVIVDYSKIYSSEMYTEEYNPLTIAAFALSYFRESCGEDKPETLQKFWNQIQWLIENQTAGGAFPFHYDKIANNKFLESGWSSAMAQGLAISALVRAYKISDEEKYLNAALRALKPFEIPVYQGGVRTDNEFGVWYEEYPHKHDSDHVLNGYIYALFGLFDLYNYADSKKSGDLFNAGVSSLIIALPLFDNGFWSQYSLSKQSTLRNHYNIASPKYQLLHVHQLNALSRITSEKIFNQYSNRFREQYPGFYGYVVKVAFVTYRDLSLMRKRVAQLVF